MVGRNGAGSGLVQAGGEQAGGWVGAGVCAQPGALSSQCWTCQGQYGLKPFNLCTLIQLFHAIPQTGLRVAATLEEFAPALLRELQPNQRPHPAVVQGCWPPTKGFATLQPAPEGAETSTHGWGWVPLQRPVGSAGLHAPSPNSSAGRHLLPPALTGLNCCLLWTLHPKERLTISK